MIYLGIVYCQTACGYDRKHRFLRPYEVMTGTASRKTQINEGTYFHFHLFGCLDPISFCIDLQIILRSKKKSQF